MQNLLNKDCKYCTIKKVLPKEDCLIVSKEEQQFQNYFSEVEMRPNTWAELRNTTISEWMTIKSYK